MSAPLEIVLVLAAVGYVLVRRMMGEAAQVKRMLVVPAVLFVIGLSQLGQALHSPAAIVFLLVSAALSVGIGALRGASVRISDRGGVAFVRYTWVTVVLWVVNLVAKFGANFVFQHIDPQAAALGNSLLITLGLGMLVEGLIVLMRAMRSESQIIWTKDQSGAPVRSPLIDNLRESMNGRPVAAGRNRYQWDADQDRRY
ncbi:MAG TPA: DUF1453 domain-containing protein [Pseudonocardiaceae bacterium]|jgi:hypothetical protein|nr:DUF1453 domain-containing protein [Pseudonocardiaceae bacterium]